MGMPTPPAGEPATTRRFRRAWWPLAHMLLSVVFVLLLARAGYPAWRTAVVVL